MDELTMQHVSLRFDKSEDYRIKEAFKTLRTNIEFSGADLKVIAVTSCTPNEGKSSVAMELAKAFAEAGKRTLLIDADMRKSVLVKKYGYVAAGYTTLACYIFFPVIHFFVMKIIVKKECENHPIFNVKGFIFISLALIAISSLLFYLYDKVILRYFLLILVSLCYSLYFMKKYRIFERIGVKSDVDKKTIP